MAAKDPSRVCRIDTACSAIAAAISCFWAASAASMYSLSTRWTMLLATVPLPSVEWMASPRCLRYASRFSGCAAISSPRLLTPSLLKTANSGE
jgi:hypothetical protein